jgi:hypothetical protein
MHLGGEEGIGKLVQALASVYDLNPDDTALRDYIRAFIAVQVGVSIFERNDPNSRF